MSKAVAYPNPRGPAPRPLSPVAAMCRDPELRRFFDAGWHDLGPAAVLAEPQPRPRAGAAALRLREAVHA